MSTGKPSILRTRLEIRQLGHRFGQRVLFRRVDHVFDGGVTTAITGSNGSGKSTLVRILAGLTRPTKGDVLLQVDGAEVDMERRPLLCGMVAPYLNVYDGFSPRENLEFLASARGLHHRAERVESALERVQLTDRADDPVGTFSSGMIQRVRLACAILADPPVLLLDEPTATLDARGVGIVRAIVEEASGRGCVVIVATNEPDEAAACDLQLDVESFR
ncbi:MAG: ABC transporter ATP-binding protein [Bacteroidetes bacterium]|nr:ABC transporter ATP-binding protein [Bacteroidota bacterium]MDA0873947.1 ABC transporter ATP-binding protein [Bacteroidota bacterium]